MRLNRRNLWALTAAFLLLALSGCAKNAADLAAEDSGAAVLMGEAAPSDIAGHPSEAYILEGLRLGLYPPPDDGRFQPDQAVTREEFVTVLWRLAGRPDAPGDDDQSRALAWADAAGLPSGASELTRQDAMSLLFAYHGGVSGAEAILTGIYDDAFRDSAQIPEGGKAAFYWGFYNVLIRETEPDYLNPSGSVSRGDMAEMTVRYWNDFQSGASENEKGETMQ